MKNLVRNALWLLGLMIAIFLLVPAASASDPSQPCAADAVEQVELVAPVAPQLSIEALEPMTGPPGSCPKPTCDALVHCLYLSCPSGQSPACLGGLGAGCEGTCGCR